MKILWISHLVPYPPKAGVLLRSHYLLKELAKYHQVDLLAFNQRNLMEPYFRNYEQGTSEAHAVLKEICNNIKIFDCPTDGGRYKKIFCAFRSLISRYPYSVNWLASHVFGQTLVKMHEREQYDLIHFDTIGLMPYLSPKLKKAALSLDHHNVESHMLFRRAALDKNWVKKIYYFQEAFRVKRLEKKYCKLVDTNITCSNLDSNRFEEFVNSNNFKAIPNGVDINLFRPSEKDPSIAKLLFIGTLDWYPNIRAVRFIAFELWRKLKQEISEVSIDIIGAKPPEDVCNFALTNPDFNVHGYVDDIKPFFDTATVYVCPINDGGGTKLKLLDAFASGKAVVADPIACEGLEVVNGIHLLFATTVEEYIQQIERLINDKNLRESLQVNARNHVIEKFSFHSIGQELAQHYDSVVRNNVERQQLCAE